MFSGAAGHHYTETGTGHNRSKLRAHVSILLLHSHLLFTHFRCILLDRIAQKTYLYYMFYYIICIAWTCNFHSHQELRNAKTILPLYNILPHPFSVLWLDSKSILDSVDTVGACFRIYSRVLCANEQCGILWHEKEESVYRLREFL